MNCLKHRLRAIGGAMVLLMFATTVLPAQFGISTGPRPSNRPVNEPPKPRTIRGVVEDEKGKPIAGAKVFIRDTKTNVTRTATTDADGIFEMKNLPPEITYDVTAEFKGVSEKQSVSGLLSRTDNVLDFRLKLAAGTTADAASNEAGARIRTFDGVELRASLDLPTGVQAPIPAVLLLHGYGEDRSVFAGLKARLLVRGWAVMGLDLRGHGASRLKNATPITPVPAWRSSAHEFPPDIEPALDWLKSQPRVDSRSIVIIGHDIGANLALIASGRFKEVRTVIAIKPNLAESLAMAGSAQDFQPRSALIVTPTASDEKPWKDAISKPIRLLTAAAPANAGAAAWLDDAKVSEAVFQWLKDTY